VIGRAASLRQDALKAKLASVAKNHVARFVDVLIEQQACLGVAQEFGERCLAGFDGPTAQVLAVKLDQVESLQEHAPVIAPVAPVFRLMTS